MPDLKELALRLVREGPHKTLATPRLVRVLFNGVYIASTTSALLVWEHPYYPVYYLPWSALSLSHVKELTSIFDDNNTLIANGATIQVDSKSTKEVLVFRPDLQGPASALASFVRIDFASMDQWFEEDTPIYVHPKDPFKRVDILQSTRRVRVLIRGVEVASSESSMHLYETGLPVRYYLPLTSIRQKVLRSSDTRTKCPYKGDAEYYHVDLGDGGEVLKDVVWYYRTPLLESARIEGLCCFYNEKVDIELDGEILERPKSKFA